MSFQHNMYLSKISNNIHKTEFQLQMMIKLMKFLKIIFSQVVHDCRNDSAAFYFQFNILVKSIFDTQAAHAVLQLQDTGKPVYKVKNVSLNALCELYNAPVNPMKEQVKNIYRRDQKFWARRPLTRDMICYAGADVLALVPTIYNAMARWVNSLRRIVDKRSKLVSHF